ncbi:recombinase family protein [Oenococcus oeni]|uniref:recombinase family protein n=1 Tax=Oenococcus oeni TaxID=1247 RepID=UPI0010AEF068
MKANKLFSDKLSGKNTYRPEFINCLAYLKEGNILEAIILDRLSRNYKNIK